MSAVAQPAGTVTLVFTDIEGSTRLLVELGEAGYRDALAEHRRVVQEAFGSRDGYEVDNQGDSFFYSFASAADAVTAVQAAMAAVEGGPIAIRVGIHTGEPGLDPPKYVGLDVHTAARIMGAGHGGQVVLSQSTRDLLDDSVTLSDLGEHRLKDLSRSRRLFQLGADRFPPLRTLHQTNLPVPATVFLGRKRELDDLGAVLCDGVRLLTLTGPGGVGKTRLALQAVAGAADSFPGGVWWVPLASVRDPQLLLSSVALALGVPEQPGQGLDETLGDVLTAARTILLIDNLEHLLADAAGPVAMLRETGATVVVTSRERLRLSGERVYPVAPLTATEAVELFSVRTAAFGVDARNDGSVSQLCSRLDNLPLAVELAAARAGLLAPAEILSRLGGRLDRLRGGRDADPRQQTLRATIGWSHDLLDPSERELFARLAVFGGGGTLDGIEAVCGADLDVLESLLDKSLVRRTGERVWMLETIREFASEQLDADPDADELRDGYARYYVSVAEASDRELRGPGQADALERFASERENLRATLEWLRGRDPSVALRLVAALWAFWFMRGHFQEGRETLFAALERAGPEPSEARASVLVGAGLFASDEGENRKSLALLEEGLACARAVGSISVEINALSLLAGVPELGQEEQVRLGEEALALAEAYGDPWLLGLATGNLGSLLASLGETERALELTEKAYRLCRDVGDVSLTVLWLSNFAESVLRAGDTVEARARVDEALELARLIDDTRGIGMATLSLGWVELLEGNLDGASSCFEEAAGIGRRLGIRGLATGAVWGFAQVAAAGGNGDRAARLAGAASVLGGSAGIDPTADFPLARHVEDVRAALGEQAWQKAWAVGAELGFDAAIELALER